MELLITGIAGVLARTEREARTITRIAINLKRFELLITGIAGVPPALSAKRELSRRIAINLKGFEPLITGIAGVPARTEREARKVFRAGL